MAQKISVISGKGGVGKSSVCAHVGFALAQCGKKVLIAELDSGFRSQDLLLGLSPDIVYDIGDLMLKRCNPEDAVIHVAEKGPDVLVASADPDFRINGETMSVLVEYADDIYDYILYDCPAGFGPVQQSSAGFSDLALVVTLPDEASCRTASRISGLLNRMGLTNQRLIINRIRKGCVPKGKLRDLDDVIDNSGVRLIGAIPEATDLNVPNAGYTNNAAERELDLIAARLRGSDVGLLIK